MNVHGNDTQWTDEALAELSGEFGPIFGGRTVLVTGADGFMGSHLTEALVALGADVHAFVRATSSGALNNIGHLRGRLKVHFADLTDKTSIDYLVRELKQAPDKPYVFHLGAQAHVGECWHRPYETVMANTVGTLNLLQSVVDHGLELEKFDTAGTSEEYGNVHEDVAHHHDFDDEGGLILHERSPINPKSIYATAKVAADFLTMNYHDAYGVPGVVTRMFNNYGPRQNPRYVTGTIITQALTRETVELGQLEPLRDFCFCTDGVRGHLTVAAHGVPGDVYVYGQGENISMADWADMILSIGKEQGYWADREIVSTRRALPAGRERRDGAARRLREAQPRDRLGAEGLVGGGRRADDRLVRGEPRALDRPRRLAPDRHPAAGPMRTLVTGGGGFLGSHLVERLRARGLDPFVPRRRDYDLTEHADVVRAVRGGAARARVPPRRRGRRDRREPRQPGPLLVREPADGRARARAEPAHRRRRRSSCSGRSASTRSSRRCRSARTTSGTATRRRRTRRTASRRSRCSSAAQAYREQYGLNAIHLLPVNLYGPRDNFDLETSHVIPALIRKMVEAGERGEREIVLWGDGSPTREFLYVEDCAEGILLAADGYDGSEPVNLGTGARDLDPRARRADRRADGLRRRDRLGHLEAERPAAPRARHEPGRGAVRLPREHAAARRTRANRRLVPNGCPGACGWLTSCGRSHGTSRGSSSARSCSCSGSPWSRSS